MTQEAQAANSAAQAAQNTQTTTATTATSDAQDVSALPAWAQEQLRAIRAEAAKHRTEANAHKAELDKLQAAQMTEQEKQAKRLADLESAAAQHAQEKRDIVTRAAVERLARRLNIVDEDAAYRLMDAAAIEYDDTGTPKNLDTLLAKLVKDRPFLVAQAAATGGSATNPGGGSTVVTQLTRAEIASMTPEQINEAREAGRLNTLLGVR